MSVFGIARDYVAAQERRYLTLEIGSVGAARRRRGRSLRESRGAGGLPTLRVAGDPCVTAERNRPRGCVERLRRVGIKSISPIVDVTNYVMMDLGQPMHAYDLARLEDGIRVRLAKPGDG